MSLSSASAYLLLAVTSSALAPAPEPTKGQAGEEPTALTVEQKQRDQALVPRAAAIVDAFPNWNGIFTSLVGEVAKDRKHLLFGSLRSGMPQIYLGDIANPADEPRAITSGTERAVWASFTRDQKYVLFNRDSGADENWRLWRVGLDGSNPTCLTPGPIARRDEPVLPRKKPDMMVYTTHVTTSPASQLIVQSISKGDLRTVYDDPSPAYAVAASPDGARALLVRVASASDLVLLEVDLSSGRAQRLYPTEGTRAAINVADYSADGRLVFVATDEGKESYALLAMDPRTRVIKARWAVDDPATAAIGGLSVSPKGDRLAVAVDAGNRNEIRVLGAHTLKIQRRIQTPLGMAGVGQFTEDGRSFTYYLSTPDHPADLFLADAATGVSTPLRVEKRAGLEGLSPLEVGIEQVRAHDGLTIPVNVYRPKVEAGHKLPTLAIFHGGPSSSSTVRWNPFVRFFTMLGYAVVEPNIRGSTGFGRAYEMADNREKRADALRDMATVNAWAKAQRWCDANRVVVFGGSYGGYLTLMAVTRQPTLWRAGVDLFGVADLKTFLRTTDQAIRAVFVQEFGDLEKDAALLEEYTPSRDYDKVVSPLFVYAGQNDPRVPRTESDQIVAALRARKIPVEYMVAANEGHSVDRRETKLELLTRVARFLADQMR